MNRLLAASAMAVVIALTPVAAHAAPAEQCFFGPLNHTALSGMWSGDDARFILNIYPCGGHSELFWTGDTGIQHSVHYYAFQTLDGGGWIGRVPYGDYGPWWTTVMGYKPAEPGSIQVIFWAPNTYEQLIVRHASRIR